MNICVAGDVHGRLEIFYNNVSDFESKLGICFDVVLQVGDFGIWIDDKNSDGITKIHNGTGDFPNWYKEKRTIPVKTCFIGGNNEDFNFLEAVKLSGDMEILKNLFYIPNGTVSVIENIIVAGVGGKYDPEHFNYREAKRYYTKYEIESLMDYKNLNKDKPYKSVDVFISHDAPEGVLIEDNDKNRYYPKAVGLKNLILDIKPKIAFFGHHHGVCKSKVGNIPVYGLNVLGESGNLMAVRKENDRIKILGSYPA